MDERLQDFAATAHNLRTHHGYSEQQIAKAAGFPDLPQARHTPSVDHIIELVLREPIKGMHAEDLEWHRRYVRRVIAVLSPRDSK